MKMTKKDSAYKIVSVPPPPPIVAFTITIKGGGCILFLCCVYIS